MTLRLCIAHCHRCHLHFNSEGAKQAHMRPAWPESGCRRPEDAGLVKVGVGHCDGASTGAVWGVPGG